MPEINIAALPIKVQLLGKTKRDDWDCFEWRVEVSSQAGFWSFPYYCGLGHVHGGKGFLKDKPKAPSKEDILHSLLIDSEAESMNFAEWCSNYDYSDDSIKALNTYKDCLVVGAMLRKHFGREVVAQLKTQLEDH